MKRSSEFSSLRWDDPFWHVVRMLADHVTGRHPNSTDLPANQIMPVLGRVRSSASNGLMNYLDGHPDLLNRLSNYWAVRHRASERALALLRTQAQAAFDHSTISDEVIKSYGVRLDGYHKSPKALVGTVDAIVLRETSNQGCEANTNPQSRAAIVSTKKKLS